MTPRRPYLLRAYLSWIQDNEMTPHILVDADYPGTTVPRDFVKEGRIVLNISTRATEFLECGIEEVTFQARFRGQPMQVILPMGAILMIYSMETRSGTVFDPEPAYSNPPRKSHLALAEEDDNSPEQPVRIGLKAVPQPVDDVEEEEDEAEVTDATAEGATEDDPEPPEDDPEPPPRGRPMLKIVK